MEYELETRDLQGRPLTVVVEVDPGAPRIASVELQAYVLDQKPKAIHAIRFHFTLDNPPVFDGSFMAIGIDVEGWVGPKLSGFSGRRRQDIGQVVVAPVVPTNWPSRAELTEVRVEVHRFVTL
jgi:hypothetical protein